MGEPAGGGRVLVASNRGPISFHRGPDGQLSARRGGGGMVSGLLTAAGQADLLWVCAALSDADRTAARAAPDGLLELSGGSRVKMLDIPARTFARAYNGVANSVLWFIHHLLYDLPGQPQFGPEFAADWGAYRDYNRAFAEALAAVPGPAEAVVQDYHLALVPRMLAQLRPDVRVAHFSHTPWAPPDYYRVLPDDVACEVLEGILGADHAGFLCRRWADAFADCCAAILGAQVDRGRDQITYRGHVTGIGVHELRHRAAQPDVAQQAAELARLAGGRKLIVRIDRTELSKNILRGLAAYRELLVSRPEWRGQVMHLAFAYPSRTDLAQYRAYAAAVADLAAQIEAEFATDDWTPLVLQADDDYARSLAGYRVADVLLVNPVRDGMNLVAKEGPIVSDRGCALVLSREAGAAAELGDAALLVNPFDITATAQALHEALSMSAAERASRSARLAAAGGAVPPARWLADQLAALR
jgi:trehalose 6-phosphate synthase